MRPFLSVAQTALLSLVFATLPLAHADEIPAIVLQTAAYGAPYVAEGRIEAVRSATVAAQVQGRIVDTRVDAGDQVRAGEALMHIDAREAGQVVAAAQAQLAQAQANAINATAQFERTHKLVAQHFVSAAALDQASASKDAAQAQLRAAQAGLAQAQTGQGYTSIVAPMSGVVSARMAETGDMAQPGKALLNVYDPTALRAVVDVAEGRVAALRAAGLQAQVEFPDAGTMVAAQSVTVLPAADPQTHTQQLRVDLPAGTAVARPGAFVRVHFASGDAPRLLLPAQAVLRRSELTAVYVSDEGRWHLRQVRVGERLPDGRVEVFAGLRGGERVALDPVRAGLEH